MPTCKTCCDTADAEGPSTCPSCGRSSANGRYVSWDSDTDPTWARFGGVRFAAERRDDDVEIAKSIPWMITRWAIGGMAVSALMLLGAYAASAQTRQCVEHGYRQVCSRQWPYDRCWTQRYCMRHAYVGSWRSDDDDERRRFRGDRSECRSMRKATGDQHLTVDGAKKAANDSWAGQVRFHLGERYMDLGNARQIAYDCSRSSIKEGGVTTLGQSLTRCEVEAIPCAPVRQLEGGGPRGAIVEEK